MLGFANQEDIGEMKSLIQTLVELLIGKGLVHLNEIEQRKASIAESLSATDGHRPQIQLVDAPDKYAQGDVVNLDCASRDPVCKGACCRLWFALSIQDLDERIVRWNYACPYGIAQGKDGRCVHQDRSSFRCNIYENRPLICRSYDCRQDQRTWLDFNNGVINPDILKGDSTDLSGANGQGSNFAISISGGRAADLDPLT